MHKPIGTATAALAGLLALTAAGKASAASVVNVGLWDKMNGAMATDLAYGMKDMLGLSFQLDAIDYQAKNFVHADMDPKEFTQSLSERQEGLMQFLMRSMGSSLALQSSQKSNDIDMLAGPFAAYQLAVLGADVIKVEHPDDPDQSRGSGTDWALNRRLMGTGFLTQGSNKRSITLDLKREQGGTFTCTVTLKQAGTLPVDVRQTDGDGTLDVTPTAAVVTKERIAKELSASLKKRFGRSFEVRCSGDPVAVRAPGSTSTCSAKDATSKRGVTVTVTDAAGTLDFAVAPAK